MMEHKHTPGPWVAEPEQASDGRGIAICAPHNGWIVATITPEDGRPADVIDEANAALISAAPDLLAALEAMLVSVYRNAPMLSHTMEYDAARAAIAKARGQA